jgi:hypothetical protein
VSSLPCPCCDQARALHARLTADDLDGAIDAGLMTFQPCACADESTVALVLQAQQRLRTAWDARERYRQREARLARRAAERDARRLKAPTVATTETARPALPSSAAAILARAKAKAAERMKR